MLRGRLRGRAAALAAVLLLGGCTATPTPTPPKPGATYSTTAPVEWLGYHADPARTGAVGGGPTVPARAAWRTELGAAVYGQLLVAEGRVLAATERNRVVALDPASSRVLWSTTVGPPLTDVGEVTGCGNVDPLGITSTPVVDPAAHVVDVVAEVRTGPASVEHRLVSLDLATGRVIRTVSADPPLPAGESAVHLLQRAGLALANGRVYVAYGGNSGDCGRYHGWVVGLATTGAAHAIAFEVAPDGEGGAIWQSGGAPAVDDDGNLYVSTGNGNPGPPEGGPDPKRYTESVVKLSPTLQPLASFKDRTAGGDEDLSTGNPVLLPGGRVFAVGKTDIAFVLDARDLHRIAAIDGVCGSDPDGGPVVDAVSGMVFVPCRDGGVQEVDPA